MSEDLDLPNSGCWNLPAPQVRLGDACHSVVLPITEADAKDDPSAPLAYSIDAYVGYALVMRVVDEYAVLAPIAIAEITEHPDVFEGLLESGRDSRQVVRLPKLDGAWQTPALAVLFKPHTALVSTLEYRRVASMSADARHRLARRVALAFAP